jgi:hypothetical protein
MSAPAQEPLSHREAISAIKELATNLIIKYPDNDRISDLVRTVAKEFLNIAERAVDAAPIRYPEINYPHLAQVMLERARAEMQKLNAEVEAKVIKENES